MTIIFDLDGTIADLWPLERVTLLRMAKVTDATVLNVLYDQGQRNLLELFQNISGEKMSREKFDEQYQNAQVKMIAENAMPMFPIFLQESFLENCGRISCGLVTGSQRSEAEFVLRQTGCRNYFSDSLMLCQGEYVGEKATGKPFLEIKKRIGSNFVVIGDSQADEDGAKCAGVRCIRFPKLTVALQQSVLEKGIQEAISIFF